MTGDDESLEELKNSIEAFERAVRPRYAAEAGERAPRSPDRSVRWHALVRPAVVAGMAGLAAMLYLGRGQPVEPQPPVQDGPAAAIAPTRATPPARTGERVAADMASMPAVSDD